MGPVGLGDRLERVLEPLASGMSSSSMSMANALSTVMSAPPAPLVPPPIAPPSSPAGCASSTCSSNACSPLRVMLQHTYEPVSSASERFMRLCTCDFE